MTTLEAATGIMARLKAETDDLHRHAERRPLQHQMVSGTVAPAAYAAYLNELLGVHAALERRLADCAGHAAIDAVHRDYHDHAGRLRGDLDALSVARDSGVAHEATRGLIAFIETADPFALLGCLYVLEGSMNGNQYIARALRGAWRTTEAAPLSYLTSHGDEQRERWGAFRRDMDALQVSSESDVSMITAAQQTFRSVAAIADEVAGEAPMPE